MTIEQLKFAWTFEPVLKEGSEIQCPECKEFSHHDDWIQTSAGCELCGDHDAIECPKCGEYFDHVFSPTFVTKSINN